VQSSAYFAETCRILGRATEAQAVAGLQEAANLPFGFWLLTCIITAGDDYPMRSHRLLHLSGLLVLGLATAAGLGRNIAAQNIAAATPGPATTNPQPSASPNPTDAPASANPFPPGPSSQFVLGAADVIHVNVWKNPDLSQTVTIGPDGFVSLPLLGEISVSNMTASQLGQSLTSRLGTYILNPQVTVSVVDIRSRQVYVLGQVAKPGGYPLIAPITVLQLIAQAGGLNPYANRKNIVVLRTTNRAEHKLTFNYNNAVRGDEKQSISLQPGDTVVVP